MRTVRRHRRESSQRPVFGLAEPLLDCSPSPAKGQYRNGQGLGQDLSEAVRWFRQAAVQGYVEAENSLGFLYDYGGGVPIDHQEGAGWYRKAAVRDLRISRGAPPSVSVWESLDFRFLCTSVMHAV